MPTLLLMRHAKSDWNADYGDDHSRPLNKRGRRAAARMGEWLEAIGEAPDFVYASSAERARTTAERAAEAGGWAAPIATEPRLYGADAARIVDFLAGMRSGERIMLVGHEPGLSWTVALLTGGAVRFPTAMVVRIDLTAADWADVSPGSGTLIWMMPPRLLDRAPLAD